MARASAYHAGFNTGFNIAEAVNFALPSWMTEVALGTKTCVCSRDCVRFDMLEFFNNVITASMLVFLTLADAKSPTQEKPETAKVEDGSSKDSTEASEEKEDSKDSTKNIDAVHDPDQEDEKKTGSDDEEKRRLAFVE